MLQVTSEIGRLRQVLVHEPGLEVDHMVPSMMEELLFDDILFGDQARQEHGRFRRMLQLLGVEVVEAQDLLSEALEDDAAREWIVSWRLHDVPTEVRERLLTAPAADLAEALVTGVRVEGNRERLFSVAPLPNWCFQRDCQVVIGDSVLLAPMATQARWREGLISRLIFKHHPRFDDANVTYDPFHDLDPVPGFAGLENAHFEGGDFLVLSPEVVAVGVSERTNRAGIDRLVPKLAAQPGGPRWLLLVDLPSRRAFMHLDTIFTPLDRDAALVFPPVVHANGPLLARVHEIDLHAKSPEPREVGSLVTALGAHGVDLEPIPAGGDDPVDQQREQWTDGANAFAVAPGVIFLYRRNVRTAEELDRRGFRIVNAEDILLAREEVDLDDGSRTCILVPSHELSRARGGPHCLTHPLVRDGV